MQVFSNLNIILIRNFPGDGSFESHHGHLRSDS